MALACGLHISGLLPDTVSGFHDPIRLDVCQISKVCKTLGAQAPDSEEVRPCTLLETPRKQSPQSGARLTRLHLQAEIPTQSPRPSSSFLHYLTASFP